MVIFAKLMAIVIISCVCNWISYHFGYSKGIDDAIYYMNALSGRWDENFSHDSFVLSDLNRIYGRKETKNDRPK